MNRFLRIAGFMLATLAASSNSTAPSVPAVAGTVSFNAATQLYTYTLDAFPAMALAPRVVRTRLLNDSHANRKIAWDGRRRNHVAGSRASRKELRRRHINFHAFVFSDEKHFPSKQQTEADRRGERNRDLQPGRLLHFVPQET
ncbi:hypothetical protein [Mitsuaria sp. 7]|uniref:hypothetical protein n=1 Tax=Mitsuaria sp. 7 TaxID=1658665 RepID=UPI0007DD86BC|nr:hypothetical protein [Mitsuaria sp. 7]ANH68100.1 hypothetical protein ABE85_11865 [Mitsuaria sp. 7]